MRICKLTEGGARRYVNACVVYHDPSESHPFHVMHDDGTHAWIAIVERSRVVHVNDPGNRGRRVTRDFTWLTPERGAREAAAVAAAAAAMEPVGGAYAHALDPTPQIPPGMMLGQWNLGYAAGGSSPWGSSPTPCRGGAARRRRSTRSRPPRSRRTPLTTIAGQARAHTRCWGRWHSRRGRRRAGRLGAPRAARGCAGPERSAPRVPIQPPAQTAHQSLAQAGFLAPRRETLIAEVDREMRPATGKRRRDARRRRRRRGVPSRESPTGGAGTGTGTGMKSRHQGTGTRMGTGMAGTSICWRRRGPWEHSWRRLGDRRAGSGTRPGRGRGRTGRTRGGHRRGLGARRRRGGGR